MSGASLPAAEGGLMYRRACASWPVKKAAACGRETRSQPPRTLRLRGSHKQDLERIAPSSQRRGRGRTTKAGANRLSSALGQCGSADSD
jgi:hypothetical protein